MRYQTAEARSQQRPAHLRAIRSTHYSQLPLQATVSDSAGHPLNNVAVNFTAPTSGAGATFPGGGSAVTNASGVAIITPTANGALGSYNVTAVVGALTAPFALTNTPATPTNVVATATTPTSVSITWNGTAGATYKVLRLAAGAVSTTIGSSTSRSLTDTTATANTAYRYSVHAIAPSASPYGAADLATTVMFTDDPLTASVMIVKAAHVTELRTAVNAVQALAGQTATTFTDSVLDSTVPIKRMHLVELRTTLTAARSALGLSTMSYTERRSRLARQLSRLCTSLSFATG